MNTFVIVSSLLVVGYIFGHAFGMYFGKSEWKSVDTISPERMHYAAISGIVFYNIGCIILLIDLVWLVRWLVLLCI